MKFKEFLNETQTNQKALEDWLIDHISMIDDTPIDDILEDDHSNVIIFSNSEHVVGVMNEHNEDAREVEFQCNGDEFNPPMGTFKWSGSFTRVEITSAKINDWSLIPNAESIKIDESEIESFNGIDKLDGVSELEFVNSSIKAKGILRIAKMPSLEKLEAGGYGDATDPDVKAMKIVAMHIKAGDDLVEIQSALIDADLDEYAKL